MTLFSRIARAEAAHTDPVVPLLLGLVIILGLGRLAGWIAVRLGQPSVLGELGVGILLGNLWLVGYHDLQWIRTDPTLSVLAELGVLLLLFEVGLESTVSQMVRVGPSALLVACVGVIAPFALGWLAAAWLLPAHSPYVHVFVGAVLTATSVGITARVLHDLGETKSLEARIILGAAVIDDVLGLVILAVVSGVITAADYGGSGIPASEIAWITGKALGFLAGAIVLGRILAPRILRLAARIRVRGIMVTSALAICFIFSYLAALADLAPIVGAFAAGLILESAHFERFEESQEHSLETFLFPVSTFLVPIFFVLTGARVELQSFADPGILKLAGVLILVAWIGKQACSLGVLQRGVDRLSIGLGMVPRGEVGLIFANVGATLIVDGEQVVTPAIYAAIVLVVIVTTLVTPPALQWSLRRRSARRAAVPG